MTRPLRALGAAGLLLAASAVAVTVGGTAHADTQVCDKYDHLDVVVELLRGASADHDRGHGRRSPP